MIQFARLFCQKYQWSRSYRSRHGVAGLDRLGLGEHLPPGPGGGAGGAAPTLQHHWGDNLHPVIKMKINFKMIKNFYIIEWFYVIYVFSNRWFYFYYGERRLYIKYNHLYRSLDSSSSLLSGSRAWHRAWLRSMSIVSSNEILLAVFPRSSFRSFGCLSSV